MSDNAVNQALNVQRPSIEKQINFVRGARHLTAGKAIVELSNSDNQMLMAIEETLLAAHNWQKLLTTVQGTNHTTISNG